MLLSDQELLKLGIDMSIFKPHVMAKLREKAATYEDCMLVGKKLTWLAYQMLHAPVPDQETASYLESYFGSMKPQSTNCLLCRLNLDFNLFSLAEC